VRVDGRHYRTIWTEEGRVCIIDQTALPHEFRVLDLPDLEAAVHAIRSMQVRGAPLIGAAGAWGLALAVERDPSDAGIDRAVAHLLATRPTAVNLRWGLERVRDAITPLPEPERAAAARAAAASIAEDDVATNLALGEHALEMLLRMYRGLEGRLDILTHCNAGWLATVDRGTATAGIYAAHDAGVPLHVWVDETRPRGQGARLTAWELGQHGVPHAIVPDTAAAHLMARGEVDVVIVGTDRTTARGDVVNKIGTLGVALAARAHDIPFYVAAPSSSLDFRVESGRDVPIEERDDAEVSEVEGRSASGTIERVRVVPDGSPVRNWAFDVTPAHLVTGIITERGIAEASPEGLAALFPERVAAARG
jgi:methylthioribose-1-phosphate isomerase